MLARVIIALVAPVLASGSALHEAASNGDAKLLKELLEAGESVEARDALGRTPLHAAAWHGAMEAIEALLEAGAPLQAWDALHWSPLHHAAWHGKAEAVRALVQAGASVDARGIDGRTPLHAAALHTKAQAILSLRKHWQVPLQASRERKPTTGTLAEAEEIVRRLPVHTWGGAAETIRVLVEEGASLDLTDENNATPLKIARDTLHDVDEAAVEELQRAVDDERAGKPHAKRKKKRQPTRKASEAHARRLRESWSTGASRKDEL